MLRRRWIVFFAVLLIGALSACTVLAGALADQRAILGGKVVSVVSVGTTVKEGDELVRVETLAGSATAARATARGVVKAVLVGAGQQIRSGDVVVRLETN